MTFVAPPQAFSKNVMAEVEDLGCNWIAIIPYAFGSKNSTKISYSVHDWQWWGERPEGVKATTSEAHKSKLKVMLKPQIYIHQSWVGEIQFSTDEEWAKWEQDYRRYIMLMLDIAIESNVEMFCVGTELNWSAKQRPKFWIELIREIRNKYKGKLTYCTNWDHYREISFWKELDYIGISAYFPLLDEKQPSVNQLKEAWKPIVQELENYSKSQARPILFTEYGYLSVDGCSGKSWELEPNILKLAVNEQAQANAYEALYASFWEKEWWVGGFFWKWFPDGQGHEGYPEKDYTPQNKKATQIIKQWNFQNP
ncbi:MAG TPA: hypothetical protein PK006_09270 [Saprospiraceae bacterium]|nr:hypothetical protein [Saprospiraceae bacterium]